MGRKHENCSLVSLCNKKVEISLYQKKSNHGCYPFSCLILLHSTDLYSTPLPTRESGAVIGRWGAIDKQHPHTIPVRL